MDQEALDKALSGAGIPDVDVIMAFENGELDQDQVVQLIQHGIDHGWAWSLQGLYGRTARDLINAGLCHPKA